MTKQEARDLIMKVGIVPVVRASSFKQALMGAEAVCSGGIPIVEITMTVPGAIELIRQLASTLGPDALVGAGTVMDAATAQRCIDAGAEFIVSPGLDVPTIEFALAEHKLIITGALTPTEVIAGWKAGADFVKIFPCSAVGGAKYIKALRGPLPQIPLVPTGGVNLDTAAGFILAGASALGVGGELLRADALEVGRPGTITEMARKFVTIVKDARLLLQQRQGATVGVIA